MASLFHPLCGSNPETLLKLLLTHDLRSIHRWPQVLIALAVAVARWPFSTIERVAFGLSQARAEPMPDPVFIVGYWRSGTTHLHNLLAQSPSFGYITPLATGLPWDVLGIVRVFEPLLQQALPSDRFVDNVAVTPTSPQEDSIPLATMGAASYYHGLYFPQQFEAHFRRDVFQDGGDYAKQDAKHYTKHLAQSHTDQHPKSVNSVDSSGDFASDRVNDFDRWQRLHRYFLRSVSIQQNHKPLLIKNPVYTGYIRHLRHLWPKAKFIHIYRNPYRVFPSTRHYFTRLLPELALQSYDAEAIAPRLDPLIFESYLHLMQGLQRDTADLPPEQWIELRFEDLQTNPLGELETLFMQLNLPDFAAARPHLESYLVGLGDYRQNQYTINSEMIAAIEQHWLPYIRRWGYRPNS